MADESDIDFEMCGKPAPEKTDFEPCIREAGHRDECYWWRQAKWVGSEIYGVQVYRTHPARERALESVFNFEILGAAAAIDVAALCAYMDAIHGRRRA